MLRPHRRVVIRSRAQAERLMRALEPIALDPDPFDAPDEWAPTTTDDDPIAPTPPPPGGPEPWTTSRTR